MKTLLAPILLGMVTSTSLAYANSDEFSPTQLNESVIAWEKPATMGGVATVQLTVTGPDGWYYRRQFSADQAITFTTNDNPAGDAPDGHYQYELKTLPAISANKRLDGEPAWQPQLTPATDKSSGAFQIKQGVIASKAVIEDEPQKQTIAENLIVSGSLCAGFDCATGESFGSDTLRLKENNLRIHFDDTSSGASFPANDWRIIINDSANGGSNKFAIEDSTAGTTLFTLSAGAPADAFFMNNSGNIGLGTATPAVNLHIVKGNTPTLRLEQDGNGGFAPQTWDVAGNESNFFVRDTTNGNALPFRIKPGAPMNSLVIDAQGEVGIGIENATAKLHVKAGAGQAKFRVE